MECVIEKKNSSLDIPKSVSANLTDQKKKIIKK